MSNYYHTPYLSPADNKPIAWATRLEHATLNEKKYRAAEQYKTTGDHHQGAAFVSCERAAGKLLADFLLDEKKIPQDEVIPIIYPPDSALAVLDGICTSFKQRHIVNDVFICHGEQYGDDSRSWKKHSYAVPPQAIALARKTGMMLICDGTICKGLTLLACLHSIPDDYAGKVLIAASEEIVSNTHFAKNDMMSPNALMKEIDAINKGRTDKKFSVELVVADRYGVIDSPQLPDMADTIQDIYEPDKRGVRQLANKLVKRDISPSRSL